MRIITVLGLSLILLMGSTSAQDEENCRQFAQDAIILLDDVRTAIEADDIDSALASITDAQDKLAKCNPETVKIDNSNETNTDDIVSNATTERDDKDPTGNFIINAPDVNPQHSISFIQFANWSPDIGNLDYYLGNDTTPIVENIAYQEVTNSIVVNSGNLSVVARPAGSGIDGEALSQLNWNFQGNSTWVVSGIGLQSQYAFFVEPISIIRTDYDDQARVRVINLIASRQRATVNTNSDIVLANGINWVGLKDTMLEPAEYTLNIELEDSTKIDNLITQEFKANITYTVVLIGMNTDEQPIQVVVIENPENVTRVKFVSRRSDMVDVYIMPDAIEVVDQLEPDTESDWIVLSSGALSFILFAPDSGPTSQELAGISRQLRPGRDVTIVVDDSGLNISEEAITP